MYGTRDRFYWAGAVLDRKEGGKRRLECGPCSWRRGAQVEAGCTKVALHPRPSPPKHRTDSQGRRDELLR